MTQVISSRSDDEAAAGRVAEALSPAAIDALLKDAKNSGTPLDGVDGLLNRMTKAVLERALQVEMSDHVGYEVGDPAGRGTRRQGHRPHPHETATNESEVFRSVPERLTSLDRRSP